MPVSGIDLVQVLANPRQVAIVGASQDPKKPAGRPMDYMQRYGFRGQLIPVTKRPVTIAGTPSIQSLTEVAHGSVEAAVITLPAPLVLQALKEAESVGVQVAVVIASGFEDRDSAIRRELDDFAASSALRIIGPNCVGSVAVVDHAYLTFSSVLGAREPDLGRVGMVTQSGALGNSLLQTLMRRHVGLAHWVSTGDEVNVGALELVAGMLSGPDIDAVGLFLEGITDLRWLPEVEKILLAQDKRLFFYKAATGAEGGAAAAGHTGRLVGSADACRGIMAEIGAREVATPGELADALAAASIRPDLLHREDGTVGVVTISGATGVMAADRIGQTDNLRLAQVSSDRDGPLGRLLDEGIHAANPLDVATLDDTTVFTRAVEAMASAGVCDAMVVIESGLAHDREVLVSELSKPLPVPVLLTSLSEDDLIPAELVGRLAEAGVPYFPTVTRAVDAMSRCVQVKSPSAPAPDGHAEAIAVGIEQIAEALPSDFAWTSWKVVASLDETLRLAEDFGYPMVLKAAGRTIQHRSELNAVGVAKDKPELVALFTRLEVIVRRAGDAIIAQRFSRGFELMISAIRDVELGAVAFVRLGGVLAEKLPLQTVIWNGWPSEQRRRVLESSQIGEILQGYRGGTFYDVAAVNDVITAALDSVTSTFRMLELNPVIVRESGASVVDALAQH